MTVLARVDADLSAADRQFLRDKVGVIRLLARQCGETVLHIGRHLRDVRDRIPGRFDGWVQAEFSWSRGHCYKMMSVAEAFDGVPQLANRFDSSALYVLSSPSAPPKAREFAVDLARDGEYVSHAMARDIIAAVKDRPELPAADVRAYFKNRTEDATDPDAEPDDVFGEYKLLWTAFKKLVTENYMVDFHRDTGTIDDDGATVPLDPKTHQPKAHYKMTVWSHERAKPVTHSSTTYLETLILEATDSHPMRTCTSCKRTRRLYEDFASKRGNKFNRSCACKDCEVERVGVHKKKKAVEKFARREAERAATRGPVQTAPTPPSHTPRPTATGR